MTRARLWFLAVTAALGGFLFGFDTIVINGAEQNIQRLWNLSGTMHGWVVSSALWGTVAVGTALRLNPCLRKAVEKRFHAHCHIPEVEEMAAWGAALYVQD